MKVESFQVELVLKPVREKGDIVRETLLKPVTVERRETLRHCQRGGRHCEGDIVKTS